MKKFVTILITSVFVLFVLNGTLCSLNERFRNFLYSNAKLINGLAHPTNEYVSSYIDDEDNLVIKNKCSLTDSYQVLKIYISPDLETFEVLRDDDFMSAFTATELLKDILIDIIKDIEKNSRDSDEENKVARAILEKIDDMDGKQLSHIIILLKWLDYCTD